MNFYNLNSELVSGNLRKKIMVYDEGNTKFKSILKTILLNNN